MLWVCFKKFFKYFGKNKRAFGAYSFLSFIVGILELFGVALTYPFVMRILQQKPQPTFWESPIVLGIAIIILFLAKNIIMIVYSSLQAKLTKNIEAEVHLKFINCFLAASYQDSAKIPVSIKTNILAFLIPNTINNFVLRLLNLNVNFFIFSLISLFLIITFPLATLITIVCAWFLIYFQNRYFKPRLLESAKITNELSEKYNQKSYEVLLNTKGIKISNREKYFYNEYKKALEDYYKICRKTLFLNTIPPYITEPFIIILLLILLLIISVQNFTEPDKLIASFAVIVSAIFRLAPTISRIQTNINGINSAMPLVNKLFEEYEALNIASVNDVEEKVFTDFKSDIGLRNINYEYEDNKPVLTNINLTIKKGEFIGIAGLSGAGKTTLVDIISGLFIPKSGEIIVDGKSYKSTPPLKIGYIPQEISILNASIKDNVAFGSKDADDNKIVEALKRAQLYDFIIQNYKDGICANPFVDSTGLSQGQKQRLAIARALYSNPDILILDEATSALDLKTEDEICHVLNSLKGEKTIIAIAHRISTIKAADRIMFMKKGSIEAIAPFDKLVEKCEDFKELVRLAK